jgi:murein L,D-transpeptidase YcbB/YkuD
MRHGLTPDGVVSEHTFASLNVPAPVRLAQLRTNLVRLRIFGGQLGERYVLCNIPGTQIEAIENGTVVSRHSAVVGKPDRASPDIQSRIVEVNFNPFWTVPPSIVRRDLIPKMQAQPDYLTQQRIRIIDPRGHELQPHQINWHSDEATHYMFKQDPGDFNSLGSIRINFPSAYGVYMHDTPSKTLFGEDFRFHSSGCVRVQNVRELVAWLLDGTQGWSRGDIDRVIRSGERRDARVSRSVAVYWIYITAWATQDGMVQFRDDIYSRDGVGPMVARS